MKWSQCHIYTLKEAPASPALSRAAVGSASDMRTTQIHHVESCLRVSDRGEMADTPPTI